MKIADMAMEVQASRLLTYHAAWIKDQGVRFSKAGRYGETARLRGGYQGRTHGGADPRRVWLPAGLPG